MFDIQSFKESLIEYMGLSIVIASVIFPVVLAIMLNALWPLLITLVLVPIGAALNDAIY